MTTAAERRAAVAYARAAGLSQRASCKLVGQHRSTTRYQSIREPQLGLRNRLRELAMQWTRLGYRFLTTVLQREKWTVNHKRVFRIYREEGLAVRKRKRRRKQMAEAREAFKVPTELNECWGMDFVSDALMNGRRFRIFNVIEALSREDLDGPIATSIPAVKVKEALDRVALERGTYPKRIVVDNGSEFRSKVLDAWAYEHGVTLQFIDPGKPIQNPITESYNGRMRDECLNVNQWIDLNDALTGIRSWRRSYNTERPHGSLGKRTPEEFAAHHRALSYAAMPT